jgi:hypothetical protein
VAKIGHSGELMSAKRADLAATLENRVAFNREAKALRHEKN